MRGITAEDLKKPRKYCVHTRPSRPKVKKPLTLEDRRKAGAKRVQKAENILFRVQELIEEAQRQISACSRGLNQNFSKLGDIYQSTRNQMYDLQRCRESGLVEIYETMARIMEQTAR